MEARKRVLYLILTALCAVTACKILLVGYDIDEQYAVSMAWRLLKGDRLLTDLWEPHQTSGWLCALLMAPYAAILPAFSFICGSAGCFCTAPWACTSIGR